MSFNTGASPGKLPPAPSRSASDIQDAAEKQRIRFYSSQGGRNATELNDGSAAASSVVKLLGGVGR